MCEFIDQFLGAAQVMAEKCRAESVDPHPAVVTLQSCRREIPRRPATEGNSLDLTPVQLPRPKEIPNSNLIAGDDHAQPEASSRQKEETEGDQNTD